MPRTNATTNPASKIDTASRNPAARALDDAGASKKTRTNNTKETTTMKTNDKARTHANTKNDAHHEDSAAHHQAVYERMRPRMRAIPADAVLAVNTDIVTMLGQLYAARAFLDEMRPTVAELPAFDMEQYDALPDCARALQYTHARYLSVIETSDVLPAMIEEGTALRDQLVRDAQALASRGLVPQQNVDALRRGQGHRDIGETLVATAFLLRSVWASVGGRTLITEEEIERAHVLGTRILKGVGTREQVDAANADVREERERAFTLAVNAYQQARRAVSFLRWSEGDVDERLPSLWAKSNAGRPKRKSDKSDGAAPQGGVEGKPADAKPADAKPADTHVASPVEKG